MNVPREKRYLHLRWNLWLAPILAVSLVLLPLGGNVSADGGLLFGPIKIGNLKLSITNPHVGYAGPKVGRTDHINYHIDVLAGYRYKLAANYHIAAYPRGEKWCAYVWESVSRRVVFDGCSDNWSRAARGAMSAIRSFTKAHIDNGNWIVKLAVWGTIALIVIDFILPGDILPFLPLGGPGSPQASDSPLLDATPLPDTEVEGE